MDILSASLPSVALFFWRGAVSDRALQFVHVRRALYCVVCGVLWYSEFSHGFRGAGSTIVEVSCLVSVV